MNKQNKKRRTMGMAQVDMFKEYYKTLPDNDIRMLIIDPKSEVIKPKDNITLHTLYEK